MSKIILKITQSSSQSYALSDLQPGKTLPEGKLEEFLDMMLMARDEWRNNINRIHS